MNEREAKQKGRSKEEKNERKEREENEGMNEKVMEETRWRLEGMIRGEEEK